MNMKRIIYILAALLLASCTPQLEPAATRGTITATLADADTKSVLSGLSVFWSEGDQIKVYSTTSPDGKVYTLIKGAGTKTGVFASDDPVSADANYFAVYPADAAAGTYAPGASATGLTVTVPATQQYAEASFGPGANVALAYGDDLGNMQFSNVGGLLRLTLKGDKTVKRIVIASLNHSEALIGPNATFGLTHSPLGIQPDDGAINRYSVTLDCGAGVPLTAGGVDFYVFLPASTLTAGFEVRICDTEGGDMTVTSGVDGNSIQVNTLRAMPAITYDPGDVVAPAHAFVDMGEVNIGGVSKHLYWATCNVGAENPWDYGDYYAWGAIAPQTDYDWANYLFMQADQSSGEHITKYTYADGKTSCIWYNGGIFKGDNGDGVEHKDFASYNYADDAARQLWGEEWRIPTDAEWKALLDDTLYDWTWTDDYLGDGSNHAGRVVTRKAGTGLCAGNSIFLPAAGYRSGADLRDAGSAGRYWSSSLHEAYSASARLIFFSDLAVERAYYVRHFGSPLRPVYCERYPLAASEVSTIDIGRVLAADGAIYADVASADANGGGARAIIAYVGKVPNYFDKFLAIALEDAYDNYRLWSEAHTAVSTFANAHPITIGATTYNTNTIGAVCYDLVASNVNVSSASRTTGVVKGWRMPSVTDWRYIFDGLGRLKAGLTLTADYFYGSTSNATPTDPLGVETGLNYCKAGDVDALRAAINAACGNEKMQSVRYWSSSEWPSTIINEGNNNAWVYQFNLGRLVYNNKDGSYTVRIRAVFAY